jgi:hypothetical protein
MDFSNSTIRSVRDDYCNSKTTIRYCPYEHEEPPWTKLLSTVACDEEILRITVPNMISSL